MPRMEVSPAQRHPASQQGGGGRWKVFTENQVGGAWGRLEDGGSLQSFWFHAELSHFQSIWEVELNEEKMVWMKVKVSFEFVKLSMTCELWIGGSFPCTSFQPSWRGRDESNESESFVTHLNTCQLCLWISVLDTALRTKVPVWWFNKSNHLNLYCKLELNNHRINCWQNLVTWLLIGVI